MSGETGCGKSTQVPQFLLDDPAMGPGCKIVCTQPRRISAIAVAERIAEERGENIGGKVLLVRTCGSYPFFTKQAIYICSSRWRFALFLVL